MKIIISPSKTLKPIENTLQTSSPLFQEKSETLKNLLLEYTPTQLENHLHISSKIALQLHSLMKDTTTYPALYFYSGTVFKQLELNRYDTSCKHYLQDHLFILDALYGCLNYNSAISYYRLDYSSSLDEIHLYDYWQEDLENLFKEEDFIINLASKEYSKQIKHGKMITIDFCIDDKGKIKRPAPLIKKARGQMLNWLILNQITSLDQIQEYNIGGYLYDPVKSTYNHYYFIKTTD